MKLLILAGLALIWAGQSGSVSAQSDTRVQELTNKLRENDLLVYELPALSRGSTLYLYVQATSGNLDPFVGLSDRPIIESEIRAGYSGIVKEAVSQGKDPIVALQKFLVGKFLAWNDDGGNGYDAVIKYEITRDGSYYLMLSNSPASTTFGNFRLLIGLNAPEILSGKAASAGLPLIDTGKASTRLGKAVQEIKGSVTKENPAASFNLNELDLGDRLYLKVDSPDPDFRPLVVLKDYGGKLLRIANLNGAEQVVRIDYSIKELTTNYIIEIAGCCQERTSFPGQFRVLLGLNSPEVLNGNPPEEGRKIVRLPTEVKIGVKLQQISNVNQKEENWGVEAVVEMEWQDPALVFRPNVCQCQSKVYRDEEFQKFAQIENISWPVFALYNQQSNRWSQVKRVEVFPDGKAVYYERFSATLQAPEFDFRKLPFDTQDFYIRFDLLQPSSLYYYADLPGFTDYGKALGEEEWRITGFETKVTSNILSMVQPSSFFAVRFKAERLVTFYLFRIILPLVLIIIVAWITFFLKDLTKRIEATTGNLLLFIAFNFTVGSDLPRLGYLALLDVILLATFTLSVITVAWNVFLKRNEARGDKFFFIRVDHYMVILYPLFYLVIWGSITLIFIGF